MAKKYVVYTALFGDYDEVLAPKLVKNDAVDYILFTDQKNLTSDFWQVRLVEARDSSPVILNRMYKMRPHHFLADYEISLYIDANIMMKKGPLPDLEPYLEGPNLALPKHFERDCVYQELEVCLSKQKITKDEYQSVRKSLSDKGFPPNFGLGENGILLRRHNEPQLIELMEEWFDSFQSGVKRDQLSLFPLLWQKGVAFTYLKESVRVPNDYFFYRPHKKNSFNKLGPKGMIIQITSRQADNYFFFVLSRVITFFSSFKKRFF